MKEVYSPQEITKIAAFFKTTSLLSSLPIPLLRQLAEICQLKDVTAGTVIYHKEAQPDFLYLIQKGSVAETVYYSGSKAFTLRIRHAGDYFGEMGILAERKQPLTILSLENCQLLALPSSYFLELVWNHPAVCHTLIIELMDRLFNNAQHRVGTMYLDTYGRLAMTILKFTVNARSRSLHINLTQQALAASSGIFRQTVTTILKQWKEAGIISAHRGSIQLLNPEALLDVVMESEANL